MGVTHNMDSTNQLIDNTMNTQQSRLHELLRKKWVLGFIGIVLLGSIALLFFVSTGPTPEKEKELLLPSQPPARPTTIQFTPEQLRTIQQQSKADEAVGTQEIAIKTKYPWFIKLPLRGEKYFVYFVRDKEVFVSLLYPRAGDNLDKIKSEVTQKLKDVYGIPVEDYSFEWKVTTQ